MSLVCKTRVCGAVSRNSESGVEPACRLPAVAGMQAAALQSGTPGCVGRGRSKQRPYEGPKADSLPAALDASGQAGRLVVRLLGMAIARLSRERGMEFACMLRMQA